MEKVQLAKTIHQLFQASQSEDRQILEHNLNEQEKNRDLHLQNVIQLILDNQTPEIADIKLSIAVYLRNFVRKIINSQGSTLNAAYLQQLLNIFYQTLVEPSVEFTIKRHLYLVFESLLQIYQATENDMTNVAEFYNNLFTSFQQVIQAQNLEATKGALLICQAAMQTIRQQNFLSRVFSGLSNLLCKLAEHYIQLLSKDLMVIASSQQADLSLENPTIQSILSSLDLIQEWINIHESILEKWESRKNFGYTQFCQSQSYATIFTQILGIIVQVSGQNVQSFISITGIQKLDNLLNKIKIKSLECLNYNYRYIFESLPNSVKAESPFLAKGLQLCPYLITTLLDISQRSNIEELVEEETYQDIIVEAIETLAIFTAEKEFYDTIVKYNRLLLVNVCLTLMRTSKPEYEQMTKDPDSFVSLALDTCDKQKSKIAKTQAAKLLESLCDNIDGAVSFITLFACQSLSLALDPQQAKINELFYNIDYLSFKDSLFFTSPQEIIGETCLVALTAISYILPRRHDLVPLFEDILAKNIDTILGQGSILLRVRMALLLGYYADMLFEKYHEAFLKIIDFLITSIGLHGDQKVIALQSADTLTTIISDKDLIPRLEPELPRIIQVLNECNLKITIKLYFSFLLDFVKVYSHAIGDSIIPFFRSLVQRILIELKHCHEKGEKNNLIINKCWNIIRQIIELQAFVPIFYNQIEEELKPLFEFMMDPQKIEFEDDIILVLKSFIKKLGQVSPTLWTIFPHLSKVFEKNKNTFGNLLDTLNQYMINGKTEIAQNRVHLDMIVNMASASLFSTEPNITIQNSEGAILFQLVFQVFAGSNTLDTDFESILNLIVRRMKQSPMADHLKRHLLCVFLTAMAYNPVMALTYLEQNQLASEFFSQLFALTSSFTNIYERKIFVVGLSNALNAENVGATVVGQNMLEIVQQIVKMLNVLKESETKAFKKAGKKEIKEDDDDEDDDHDDDDDSEDEDDDDDDIDDDQEESKGEPTMDEEETKEGTSHKKHDNDDDDTESDNDEDELDEVFDLNVTMDLLNAPFKKTDEFAIFNHVLRNLHGKDATYINNLLTQLSEDDKKFLKEHIETKRIQIEHKGVATEVARRIITVKRRGGVGSGAAGQQ